MNLRSLVLPLGVAALLAPIALMAAEAVAEKPKAEKPKAEKRVAEARCEPVTGSYIRRDPKKDCKSSVSPLRSYTAEDIQRTGENDLGAALKKIDPTFQ